MKLRLAEQILSDLMDRHLDDSWTYRFGQAVRFYGYCTYDTKTITISEPLTVLNSESDFINTVLHEIAHALAGKGTHHGYKWQAIAKNIGCDARRCYGAHVIRPKGKWLAYCVKCAMRREYARKREAMVCGACCRKHNFGKYDIKYKLSWRQVK